MRNQIWNYIAAMYNDGVLVSADDVYTMFQLEFDNGYPTDVIDEVMEDFINCSSLDGIKIEYEGEINGVSFRRVAEEPKISQKTA